MIPHIGFVGVLFVLAGHLREHQTSLHIKVAPAIETDGSNMVAVSKNSSTGSTGLLGTRNRLYLCNNHQEGALMAYAGKERKLITTQQIPPKTCREYVMPMYIGDVIHLEVGKANTMVFLPSEPIGDDGVVLFAVYQGPEPYNALLAKTTFFRRLVYPQVVVVDVANAIDSNADRIKLVHHDKPRENILLTYDQVTPVDRGFYTVEMVGSKGTRELSTLSAAMGETYVIMRTGSAEVVVYPSPHMHSGASRVSVGLAASGFFLLLWSL